MNTETQVAPASGANDEGYPRYTFGARHGTKHPVTFHWSAEVRYFATINTASQTARAQFAKAAVAKAKVDDPACTCSVTEIEQELAEFAYEANLEATAPSPSPAQGVAAISNHAGGLALAPAEIVAGVEACYPAGLARIGARLFVVGPDHTPRFFESTAQLFAWLRGLGVVDWAVGPTMMTDGQFFEHLRAVAPECGGIETMPHSPAIPGRVYAHQALPSPAESDGHLRAYLSHFTFASAVDRELAFAAALTLGWGGPPGARPFFVFGSPDGATRGGRGYGKSTFAQQLAGLYGGAVRLTQGEPIATLQTRLLSPAAANQRVALLDNMKSFNFSDGGLESLITTDVISGRALYVGEGRRNNTITYMMTVNGARVSTDFARRSVFITMGEPEKKPNWEAELKAYVAANGRHILADIHHTLARTPVAVTSALDFQGWEEGVLGLVEDPAACQETTRTRRTELDAGEDDRETFLGVIREQLEARDLQPEKAHVVVSKQQVAEWWSKAAGEKFSTAQTTGKIKLMGIEELSASRGKAGNTWIWKGEATELDKPEPIKPIPWRNGHCPCGCGSRCERARRDNMHR